MRAEAAQGGQPMGYWRSIMAERAAAMEKRRQGMANFVARKAALGSETAYGERREAARAAGAHRPRTH